ncbi:MAG: transcriptional regulator of sugar metabolism [Clostridia bacterium]|nr:transcriptional regulator of sugar metabolism [Clostridia bacterium]
MLAIERHNLILKLLAENDHLTTNEFCDLLNVSAATVRNDLNKLEKKNLIHKTHGGASLLIKSNDVYEASYTFHKREGSNSLQKDVISEAAIKYIKEDQCIILDASSTALALAKKLGRFSRLTVVTNGIYTMLSLKEMPNITVIFIGGVVTKHSGGVEGVLGCDILNHINVDIAFVSGHGFALEEGLTDFNIYEVELKKQMLKHGKKCIALFDSSKLEKVSTASFGKAEDIHLLITDSHASEQTLAKYKNSNLPIEVCLL